MKQDDAANPVSEVRYAFRLFVAGQAPRSLRAITVLTRFCAKYMPGADVTIIDIFQHPEAAQLERVVAAPTLVRDTPSPARRFTGDMDENRLVVELFDEPVK
jgi:circadian clock protein KaiB